jgi:restriction system protein
VRDRNPLSPWNPSIPTEITPSEFELLVLSWLRRCSPTGDELIQSEHLGTIDGAGGEYKIDVLVRLKVFDGAVVVILVECKHQARPVEREEAMVLEAKLRDVGAHKGMLFSTSGFQRGAIKYATAHGLATIAVVNGEWLYETKSMGSAPVTHPTWARFERFAGLRMASADSSVSCHTIELGRVDALTEWLAENSV